MLDCCCFSGRWITIFFFLFLLMYPVLQIKKLHRVVWVSTNKLTPVCLGAATSQAVCEWLFCNKCKAAGAMPLGSRGDWELSHSWRVPKGFWQMLVEGLPYVRMMSFMEVQAQSPVELLSWSQSIPCAGLAEPPVSAAKMGRELIWVGVCFSSYSLGVQWCVACMSRSVENGQLSGWFYMTLEFFFWDKTLLG